MVILNIINSNFDNGNEFISKFDFSYMTDFLLFIVEKFWVHNSHIVTLYWNIR